MSITFSPSIDSEHTPLYICTDPDNTECVCDSCVNLVNMTDRNALDFFYWIGIKEPEVMGFISSQELLVMCEQRLTLLKANSLVDKVFENPIKNAYLKTRCEQIMELCSLPGCKYISWG